MLEFFRKLVRGRGDEASEGVVTCRARRGHEGLIASRRGRIRYARSRRVVIVVFHGVLEYVVVVDGW